MQPFVLADDLKKRYADYIRTAFPFADPDIRRQIEEKIERESLLAKGPIVALQRDFAPGKAIADLYAAGELNQKVASIFEDWQIYAHQLEALQRLNDRSGGAAATIVTTGTGSGKTEAFLLPILDYCARRPGDGVKALILYPMNALANDQLERLRKYLHGTGITFGRYTGETARDDGDARFPGVLEFGEYKPGGPVPAEECWSRDAIRRRRPNILLTGYRMLELLLVRREDQTIFRPGGSPSALRYLVLDEVHTYTGALGAEVACLLRRLRGHVDKHGASLVCVGTSATVGEGQRDEIIKFASKLFAVSFNSDSVVEERYADHPPSPAQLSKAPDVSEADLQTIGSLAENAPDDQPRMATPEIVAALDRLIGPGRLQPNVELPAALHHALSNNPTVGWLRVELEKPTSLGDLVTAFALRPERAAIPHDRLAREISAYLILGTAARSPDGPLLRPRLHAIFRGLSNATRCVLCGALMQSGDPTCGVCRGRTMVLEACRTCGQDYLRAGAVVDQAKKATIASLGEGFQTRLETRDELFQGQNTTIRFVSKLHELHPAEEDELDREQSSEPDDEEDFPDGSRQARTCGDCGFVTITDVEAPCAKCGSERTVMMRAVRRGKMIRCANCNGTYGANREPMTALASSTAIGVSILTWLLMGRLPESERRLLIFADSRQDTAYQAGYLGDITGEYSWRQLTYRLVKEQHDAHELSHDLNRFWDRLYTRGLSDFRIFRKEDKKRQIDDLRWFVLQEFSRVATRRTGLEYLGLVQADYRDLGQVTDHPGFAALRTAAKAADGIAPFGDAELVTILALMLDLMRYAGALSDEFTRRYHDLAEDLRGLDRFNRKPVAFMRTGGEQRFPYARLRAFTSSGPSLTSLERLVKRFGVEDWRSTIIIGAQLLEDTGYVVRTDVGGEQAAQKQRDVLSVNAGLLALEIPTTLWQCANCGLTNRRNVRDVCLSHTCPGGAEGELRSIRRAADSNFYVSMYTMGSPIRIEAKEHSGQISGHKREEYERRFRDGDINVLVASPTLELGVDIGQLSTVLMRGLPPSPANYAQRAGRAGRRERIALVNAYAQPTPHDAYFYARPELIIAGRIAAPVFGLDNREIVRRHIRALALEKLESQLPRFMSEFLDVVGKDARTYDDYVNSKIVEKIAALGELSQRRTTIADSVTTAFAADLPGDLRWLSRDFVHKVLDDFEADLYLTLAGWHFEVVQVAKEIVRLNKVAAKSPQEKHQRDALEYTLRRLTQGRGSHVEWSQVAQSYTLSYLAEHGFLPSYAFPGAPATLFAPDATESEVTRDPTIAITEFAPGNVVYVDGHKVLCNGLMIGRTIAGSPEAYLASADSRYFTCSACGHVATTTWIGECPSCAMTGTANSRIRLPARYFRGHQSGLINSSEEARRRKAFDIKTVLVGTSTQAERYDYQICPVQIRRHQCLMQINSGFYEGKDIVPFWICLDCGEAKLPQLGDWDKQHEKRVKHKPRLICVDLTNEFESDVLILEPRGLSAEACSTLREALLSAASLEYDADRDELAGFELTQADRGCPHIVLYEAVSGGAGYVQRIAANMPRLSKLALDIFAHEPDCDKACYQCLLTYQNQREHESLDKKLVQPFLSALSSEPVPSPVPVNDTGAAEQVGEGRAETAAEAQLLAAVRRRKGLARFSAQGKISEIERGLVTKPDLLFPKARIAVYVDGGIHDDPIVREKDERVRRRARELGYRLLVFRNDQVFSDAEACVDEIQRIVMDV